MCISCSSLFCFRQVAASFYQERSNLAYTRGHAVQVLYWNLIMGIPQIRKLILVILICLGGALESLYKRAQRGQTTFCGLIATLEC